MSTSKTSILLTGATGYIGGSVLARLLSLPNASNLDITVLVRSPEKATKFESFGVRAVVGDQTDYAKLEQLSEKAQVVLQIVCHLLPALSAS